MEAVTSRKPALVHFFDLAQLNSIRSLPYVRAWSERYQPLGLAVYGVHTPRWPLTEDSDDARSAIEALDLPHPVAIDAERAIWRDYGCHGWPHLFIWKQGGWLEWAQLGEGDYESLESAIRSVLEEADSQPAQGWPEFIEPMRASDVPEAELIAPSGEMLLGGSLETPWSSDGEGAAIEASYQGAGAYASVGGKGALRFSVDDSPPKELQVDGPQLVTIAEYEVSGEHTLTLSPDPGIEVYSLSFAPGTA